MGLDHFVHDGGGGGESGLHATLASGKAKADGDVTLSHAAGTRVIMPGIRVFPFKFIIRFIPGLAKRSWLWAASGTPDHNI